MIRKQTLVFISFLAAVFSHFIFYFVTYGPPLSDSLFNINGLIALASSLILAFIYIGTNWRSDFKDDLMLKLYDLLILLIFISVFRSMFNTFRIFSWKETLISPYVGLSLFPILFLIIGINHRYFYWVNRILLLYTVLVFIFSLLFIKYFELQFFILMPLFYIIVTYPLESPKVRVLTLIITITVIATSLTNRAGLMRLSISYLIVIIYYFILKMRVSKKLINVIVFLILTIPFYLLYLGISGKNVFTMVLGENNQVKYGQENLKADTRTFLYVDVFRDLKINNSFIFGKGINAGYASDNFETFNRLMAEVGFLQMLLKTGILGFILYISLIVSAIFKALNKSNNLFIKYLGLLLAGYVVMFFIENVILFNILNIIIWIAVGMCHSKELRELNDQEIRELYMNEKAS